MKRKKKMMTFFFSCDDRIERKKKKKKNCQSTMSTFVTPGQRLGHADDLIAGDGTYYRLEWIHASVAGIKNLVEWQQEEEEEEEEAESTKNNDDDSKKKTMVCVQRSGNHSVAIPQIGSEVTARVVRVNPRLASVEILCIGDAPLAERYQGIVRVHDVRATEIDKAEIYKSFRPGDIIRAEIISLGTARSYYLSTAKNAYGVIWAKSVADAPMIPASWQSMQCPKTQSLEYRKVARIQSQQQASNDDEEQTSSSGGAGSSNAVDD
jgi:exosome complex component CSL4